MNQLDTSPGPVVLQLLKQKFECVGRHCPVEQNPHVTHRQRLLSANKSRFEDALGIRRIHGLDSEMIRGKGAGRRWSHSCATTLSGRAMRRVEENYCA